MVSRELIGMWRYAISPHLRMNIRRISLKVMCLKIDPSGMKVCHGICGTTNLKDDCPFCVNGVPPQNDLCLAPNLDNEWVAMRHLPIHNQKKWGKSVIGCYLYPYAERGYKTFQNLKAWKRRCHQS